jgi:hypothetical protein
VAIVTDIDDGTKADVDLPSPSKAGAIEVAKGEDGKTLINGQADEEEDDWSKTGWAPQFGWPTELVDEGEDLLDHTTWVESQLAEKFFGGRILDGASGPCVGAYNCVTQTGTTTRQSLPLPVSPRG